MIIKVKLHSYLVTDNDKTMIVPADHKMSREELKTEQAQHTSVYYVGLREYSASVVTVNE